MRVLVLTIAVLCASVLAATARAGLERDKEDPDLLFRLAASLEREKKVS